MKLKDTARCGICAALICICAWLSVPFGDIALTLQGFGIFLSLLLLGGGKGSAACGVYLLLGAVGLPVFSGFRGGLGILIGPTGGYLWGYLLGCLLFWLLEKRLPLWVLLILVQLICYLWGTVWFYFAYAHGGLLPVILKCVVPYLVPDGCKIAFAWLLSRRLRWL